MMMMMMIVTCPRSLRTLCQFVHHHQPDVGYMLESCNMHQTDTWCVQWLLVLMEYGIELFVGLLHIMVS